MTRSFLHDHTELQFSDRYDNISVSATSAEGANCVRFKDIGYTDLVKWDTVCIPATPSEEDLVYNAAKSIEGQPYNFLGLLSFATEMNIIHPAPNSWWCTEVGIWLIKHIPRYAGLPLIPDQTHPTKGDTICRWFFESLTEEQQTSFLRDPLTLHHYRKEL
jgi:hypothetical protein